jgi:hypothetical protein
MYGPYGTMTAFIAILLIVFLGAALLALLSGIALYARLVKLRGAVNSARSEVDEVLKKRKDRAPGLQPAEFADNVAAVVRRYNATVRDYNSSIETFPAQIVAKLLNLEKAGSLDKENS